jgi:hypothetical protein
MEEVMNLSDEIYVVVTEHDGDEEETLIDLSDAMTPEEMAQ